MGALGLRCKSESFAFALKKGNANLEIGVPGDFIWICRRRRVWFLRSGPGDEGNGRRRRRGGCRRLRGERRLRAAGGCRRWRTREAVEERFCFSCRRGFARVLCRPFGLAWSPRHYRW